MRSLVLWGVPFQARQDGQNHLPGVQPSDSTGVGECTDEDMEKCAGEPPHALRSGVRARFKPWGAAPALVDMSASADGMQPVRGTDPRGRTGRSHRYAWE